MRYPANRHLHLKIYPKRKRRCFNIGLKSRASAQSNAWARKAFQAEELRSSNQSSIKSNCQTQLTPGETMGHFTQDNGNLSYYQRLRAGTEIKSSLELREPMRQHNVNRSANQNQSTLKLWETFPQLLPKLSSTQCQLNADEKVKSYSELRELGTAISQNYLNEVNELFELRKVYDLLRVEQKELAKDIERRSIGLTEVICRHKKTLEQIDILEDLMEMLKDDTLQPLKTYAESEQMKEPCFEEQIDKISQVSTPNDGAEKDRFSGGFNRNSENFLQVTTTYAAVQKYAYRWLINAGIRKRSINMGLVDMKLPAYNTTPNANATKILNKIGSTTSITQDGSKQLPEHPSLVSDAASNKTYIETDKSAKRRASQGETKSQEDETTNSKKEIGMAKEDDKGTKKSKKQKNRKRAQSVATDGNGKKKRKARKGSKRENIENVTDQATNRGNKDSQKSNENFPMMDLKTSQEAMLATKGSMRSIRSVGASSRGSRKKRDTGPLGKLRSKDYVKSDISLLEEYWGLSLRQSLAQEDPITNMSTISSVLDNLIVEERQKPHLVRTKSVSSKKSIKPKKPEEISDLLKLVVLLKECEECEKKQKNAEYQALKLAEQKQKEYCDLMRKAAGLPDCLPDDFNITSD